MPPSKLNNNTYERRCDDWLKKFGEWTLPRCEASEQYVFWTGIFCLSATLRRKVYIPKKILGSWSCYPHTYIMFVGPAGLRKTTTMGYASDLLEQIPALSKGPTFVSSAALIDSLVKSDDCSIYLLCEEFGDIILKTGHEMYEFLTSMFDGKKTIESKTIGRGIEFAIRPCLNMFGATTPEWVAANIPEAVIGGGFASRVIFIYEDKIRQRSMYYRNVDWTLINEIEKDLVSDLNHIANSIEGEFMISNDALEFMEKWYQDSETNNANKKLRGYLQRKPTHLHKLAQLLHISYSDELILFKQDFKNAIGVLELTEVNLPKVFSGIGKNPYTFDMMDIISFVNIGGKVKEEDVLRNFSSVATPNQLRELVDGLCAMNKLKRLREEDIPFLIIGT